MSNANNSRVVPSSTSEHAIAVICVSIAVPVCVSGAIWCPVIAIHRAWIRSKRRKGFHANSGYYTIRSVPLATAAYSFILLVCAAKAASSTRNRVFRDDTTPSGHKTSSASGNRGVVVLPRLKPDVVGARRRCWFRRPPWWIWIGVLARFQRRVPTLGIVGALEPPSVDGSDGATQGSEPDERRHLEGRDWLSVVAAGRREGSGKRKVN